jgi:predicted GNAT superfamily acetyltransferase
VGFALKLHQRSWALARGVRSIEWTFDPLIRRNAYFNLVKLGARPAEYLPNFYGAMFDAINGTADSDRLLIAWDLRSPLVTDACAGKAAAACAEAELADGASVALSASSDGWPVPGTASGRVHLIAVPRDIEGLRVADPACAAAWRTALRGSLEPLLAAGARVTGFDRSYNGAGWYVVTTESPSPPPPLPLPPLPRLPPQEESP